MLTFVLKKLAVLVVTFFGVSLVAFFFVRLLPGDPVSALTGHFAITAEQKQIAMKALGLDKPVYVQYLRFVGRLFHGDFGASMFTRKPILDTFLSLFPATAELSLSAMVIGVGLGLPLGILAALKRGAPLDLTVMGVSLIGYSMPIFWWGLLLILLFSVTLGWTPVAGRLSLMYDVPQVTGFMLIDTLLSGQYGAFLSAARHLILPSVVLGTLPLAVIARQTRSAMLEVLDEDYIRTARAKGLPVRRVVFLHALRNALMTVVTVIGLMAGLLAAGAVLTESVFAWPGIGTWLLSAVSSRDYPAVQGGMLLVATIIIVINTFMDILYGWINPKVRGKG